jgi:GNAT superfamily N-acetyltransferase
MKLIRIRPAKQKDVSTIDRIIVEWQNWKTPRKESIKRAVKNKELLVADLKGELVGFIHYVMHEDIIDGGLNSFVTCFYVAPRFRNKGIGSTLLNSAIGDALDKSAIGIETSTANPDARRLYEKHHFRQFMGNWTMGEVFLELDMKKHKQNQKTKNT